jgi:hypothetical protein
VLINNDVLLNRSLSHCVSQENHLEYHIVSTLYTEENNEPITWAPSPLTGLHIVSSPSQRERHTQLMGFLTPHRGTQRSISVSKRNYTPILWAHPTHGLPHLTQGHTTFHFRLKEEQHTHLMGFLSGRLTQFVSQRMSHAAVIINKKEAEGEGHNTLLLS